MSFGDIENSKRLASNVERIFPVHRVRYVMAKGQGESLFAGERRRQDRRGASRRRDLYAMGPEDVVTLSRNRQPQSAAPMEDYSSLKPRVVTSPPATTSKSSGDETEEEDFFAHLTPDQTGNH